MIRRLFPILFGLALGLAGCDTVTTEATVANGVETSGYYVVDTVKVEGSGSYNAKVHETTVNWLKHHPEVKLISAMLITQGGEYSTYPTHITFIGEKKEK